MSDELVWLSKAIQVLALLEQYLLRKEMSWFEMLLDEAMLDCTYLLNVATHQVLCDDREAAVLTSLMSPEWKEQGFVEAWEVLRAMPLSYCRLYSSNWSDALTCIKSSAFQKLLTAEALFRADNQQRDNETFSVLVCVLKSEILYPRLTSKLYRFFPAKRRVNTPTGRIMSASEREVGVMKGIRSLLYASPGVKEADFDFAQLADTIKEKIRDKPSDSFALLQLAQYFTWDKDRLNAYVDPVNDVILLRENSRGDSAKALSLLDPIIWPRTNFSQMFAMRQVLHYVVPFEENVRQVSQVLIMLNSLEKHQAALLVALILKINVTLDTLEALLQQQALPTHLDVAVHLSIWRQSYPGILVSGLLAFFCLKDVRRETLLELLHLTMQQFCFGFSGSSDISQRVAMLLERSLAEFFKQAALNRGVLPPCSPVFLSTTALGQMRLSDSALTSPTPSSHAPSAVGL